MSDGFGIIFTGVMANTSNVYNDPKRIEVETKRPLKVGEINMARTIFKQSIDYNIVYICKGNAFHNWTGNARTIGNEITLPAKDYDQYTDFSDNRVDIGIQTWFIHEMVHVWQYQLGYNTVKTGACLLSKGKYFGKGAKQNGLITSQPEAYAFDVVNDRKDFPDYNMEQQAEIISDYFEILKFGAQADFYSLKSYYERILKQFLIEPKDEILLPKTRGIAQC